MLDSILQGVMPLLSFKMMLIMFFGSSLGMLFGFIPGLDGVIGLTILIPLVYGMPLNISLALLLSMHASIAFGGSISAILFNVPGSGLNIATCFDGYPMSQKGEAAKAIGIAGTSSFIGGFFGALVLAIFLPVIRPFILLFGPAEFLMVTIFGLSIIALLTAGNIVKGLISGGLGLMISFIGLDYITATARYTFDYLVLWDGIHFIPVTIGLFAIAQMLELYISSEPIIKREYRLNHSTILDGIKYTISKPGLLLRSSIIGTIIGIIPGVGGSVANILAYGHALQTTKNPETFGQGNPEGVIGPETANNAKEGGSLIPTLSFGIPGSQGMAVLLGAFVMLGIVPGPEMINENINIVFMLVFIIIFTGIFSAIIGFLAAKPLQKLIGLPVKQIIPIVLSVCLIGSYLTSKLFLDILISFTFGIIGYYMKKFEYSRAALIIALVLGTHFERYFHIAVRLYGSFFVFKRPISLFFLIFIISIFFSFFLLKSKPNSRMGKA